MVPDCIECLGCWVQDSQRRSRRQEQATSDSRGLVQALPCPHRGRHVGKQLAASRLEGRLGWRREQAAAAARGSVRGRPGLPLAPAPWSPMSDVIPALRPPRPAPRNVPCCSRCRRTETPEAPRQQPPPPLVISRCDPVRPIPSPTAVRRRKRGRGAVGAQGPIAGKGPGARARARDAGARNTHRSCTLSAMEAYRRGLVEKHGVAAIEPFSEQMSYASALPAAH